MKLMKKAIIAVALAAVVVLGITYVYAEGPGFGPGHGRRDCAGFWKDSSLTSEQKTQLQDLREKFREDMAPLRETIHTKGTELRSLWADPKADPRIIQEREAELRELTNQMRDKMVQHKLEARNFLTPEQISELGSCWGKGRGRGRGCL
jgi:Spy/CpxP family protein refolding chaperone